MPNVDQCPHCFEEITQSDVDEFVQDQREEELNELFYSQPESKKLSRINALGELLSLVGWGYTSFLSFSYFDFIPSSIWVAVLFVLFCFSGLIPGLLISLWTGKKTEKAYKEFKLIHGIKTEEG